MGNVKLKVDFAAGVLEVEGDESFVTGIYEDFRGRASVGAPSRVERSVKHTDRAAVSEGKPKKASRKESFAIVKDLDLSVKNNSKSLKDFYREKAPTSALQSNAVFAYYLKRIANVPKISADHFYTCYKDVGVRVPTALKQSLMDTASKKGWLDTSSMEDIKLTTSGENFVEHDLVSKQRIGA